MDAAPWPTTMVTATFAASREGCGMPYLWSLTRRRYLSQSQYLPGSV